jgi:MYND finger
MSRTREFSFAVFFHRPRTGPLGVLQKALRDAGIASFLPVATWKDIFECDSVEKLETELQNMGASEISFLEDGSVVYTVQKETSDPSWMATLNPNTQVVLIAGCVVHPTKDDISFKAMIINSQSHKSAPHVYDSNGQVIRNPVWSEERRMCFTPSCNHCGANGENLKLQARGLCKAARYCGKECQRKDWPDHKKRCKITKDVRKDGKKFLKSAKKTTV